VEGIHSDTLFVFIDEIRAKASKKSSLLKKLSDGYLIYNKLYQSGSYEMSTRAKLIINSNSPLLFDDDDDAIRNRILYWKFDKKFSKSTALVVDNVSVFKASDTILANLSVAHKSAIFLFFALRTKSLDLSVNLSVPIDILTKNQLVNWRDFVSKHFQLRRNSYVSKELVFQLFKETYPDFEYSAQDIIKVF
jgi:predicted transcriptional regulator